MKMNTPTPRISKAKPLPGRRLAITWKSGGKDLVDLGGVIAEVEALASIADAELFRTVRVCAYGRGVEWDDGTDYSADSLDELAREQRHQFTGADFKAWQDSLDLTINEAAALLEVDPSTVKNYRAAKKPLKRIVRLACSALNEHQTVRRAHRGRRRPVGRPRKMRESA